MRSALSKCGSAFQSVSLSVTTWTDIPALIADRKLTLLPSEGVESARLAAIIGRAGVAPLFVDRDLAAPRLAGHVE